MDLRKIQFLQKQLIEERNWNRFSATQVFTHLIEELGEIASHFLYDEKYKIKGLGHTGTDSNIEEEFGQAFSLFMQLADYGNVDLEQAWKIEYEHIKERFSAKKWKELSNED